MPPKRLILGGAKGHRIFEQTNSRWHDYAQEISLWPYLRNIGTISAYTLFSNSQECTTWPALSRILKLQNRERVGRKVNKTGENRPLPDRCPWIILPQKRGKTETGAITIASSQKVRNSISVPESQPLAAAFNSFLMNLFNKEKWELQDYFQRTEVCTLISDVINLSSKSMINLFGYIVASERRKGAGRL